MARDTSFNDFIGQRASYRKGVVDGTFAPYERLVTTTDPTALVEAVKADPSIARQAAAQNAADMMLASARALDMRKMAHRDYIAAYTASTTGQDNYEKSRLDRFNRGQV